MKGSYSFFVNGYVNLFKIKAHCRDDDNNAVCKSLIEKTADVKGLDDRQVPKGFFAVYVGKGMQRFVVPTSYLCTPAFQALMERAAEEFGFEQSAGIRIPCNQDHFEKILAVLDASTRKKRPKHRRGVGMLNMLVKS